MSERSDERCNIHSLDKSTGKCWKCGVDYDEPNPAPSAVEAKGEHWSDAAKVVDASTPEKHDAYFAEPSARVTAGVTRNELRAEVDELRAKVAGLCSALREIENNQESEWCSVAASEALKRFGEGK